MLKVTRIQERDRGLYSCLASNEAGEARRTFSVEVLGTSQPPRRYFYLHLALIRAFSQGTGSPSALWNQAQGNGEN